MRYNKNLQGKLVRRERLLRFKICVQRLQKEKKPRLKSLKRF